MTRLSSAGGTVRDTGGGRCSLIIHGLHRELSWPRSVSQTPRNNNEISDESGAIFEQPPAHDHDHDS